MLGQLRADIYKRDAVTCQSCGNRADTIDHIVPIRSDGPNEPDNLAAACKRCNTIKGRMYLPNLAQAFLLLIRARRTSAEGYPILLWQALLLGYPVEDIPWTHRRTKWSMRKLADLLFRNPDQPGNALTHADTCLLLSRTLGISLEEAQDLIERLVRHGYMLDAEGAYRVSYKAPPPDVRKFLPRAPERIYGGAFPLVGEPRRWFTVRELKREIRKELCRLSPTAGVDLRRFWDSFRKLEAFYDCDPYILIDRRVPLSLLVREALEQIGSS